MAFVVHPGDLVVDTAGGAVAPARALFATYQAQVAGLEAPLFSLPGNHEHVSWYMQASTRASQGRQGPLPRPEPLFSLPQMAGLQQALARRKVVLSLAGHWHSTNRIEFFSAPLADGETYDDFTAAQLSSVPTPRSAIFPVAVHVSWPRH